MSCGLAHADDRRVKTLENKVEELQSALLALHNRHVEGAASRSAATTDMPTVGAFADFDFALAETAPDVPEPDAIPVIVDDEDSEDEESEEDPLQPSTVQAPLRSMLQAVATSRFPIGQLSPVVGRKRSMNENTPSDVRRAKRLRIDDEVSTQLKAIRSLLPFTKGDFSQQYMDPIDLGVCSEEEGRRLFDLSVRLQQSVLMTVSFGMLIYICQYSMMTIHGTRELAHLFLGAR